MNSNAAPNPAHMRLLPPPADATAAAAPRSAVPAQPVEPLRIAYTTTAVRAEAYAHLQRAAGLVRGGDTPLDQAFRLLRHRVLAQLPAERGSVLAITCPAQATRSAKSMTALNLALCLATGLNHTALLVDADLAGDGVQRLFGFTPSQPVSGLSELLAAGADELPALLINPGIERFVLLPAGAAAPHNAAERLASRAAAALVAELRERYPDRITLVDLPPLLDSAEALAFLPHADAVLMVVEQQQTALQDLERAAELLVPYHLLGTVLAPPPLDPVGRRRSWWRWLLAQHLGAKP